MSNRKKFYATTLLVATLVVVNFTFIYLDHSTVKIRRLHRLDKLALPSKVKYYLLNQNEAKLALIQYDGKSIYTYTHDSSHYTTALTSVLTNLKIFAQSKNYKLLQGNYLLAIDDGVHKKLDYPVLGFATIRELANENVILIPDHQVLKGYEELFAKIDISIKHNHWDTKQDKIFWRGGHSVDYTHSNNDFEHNPRLKFINLARKFSFTDIGISNSNLYINPVLKQELIARNLLKDPILPEHSLGYRYLFDLDGYSCSYVRMAWILYSNSMLMKHTSDRVQWYYDQLKPFVHYLPIVNDFGDLEQKFVWAQAHPNEAKAIADNGRELAKQAFAKENVLRALEQGFIKYHTLTQEMLEE